MFKLHNVLCTTIIKIVVYSELYSFKKTVNYVADRGNA